MTANKAVEATGYRRLTADVSRGVAEARREENNGSESSAALLDAARRPRLQNTVARRHRAEWRF